MKNDDKNILIESSDNHNLKPRGSIIGPGLVVEGIFKGNSNLNVSGMIIGNINLGENNILVEKEGKVKGDIQARHILIKGNVKGNLFASGRVIIESGAILNGNITAESISIRENAQFKGRVKMTS